MSEDEEKMLNDFLSIKKQVDLASEKIKGLGLQVEYINQKISRIRYYKSNLMMRYYILRPHFKLIGNIWVSKKGYEDMDDAIVEAARAKKDFYLCQSCRKYHVGKDVKK